MPTETFTSDGSVDIPTGVSEVEVLVRGSAGGSGSGSTEFGNPIPTQPGGSGYKIEGVLPVSGGDTLYVRFGGGGYGGSYSYTGGLGTRSADGGNGGAAADIRVNGTALSDRAVVAAGGGGGAAAIDGSEVNLGAGGNAGLNSGQAGGTDYGGGGGTQSAGGTGAGPSGSLGSGGDGEDDDSDESAAGAGGGGYYGGGGGGALAGTCGGGGGGSSYTGGLSSVANAETHTNGRYVEISYEAPPAEITDLSATVVDGDQIDLSFTPADNADDHNVYRSTVPGVSKSDQLVGTTTDGSFSDTALLDGTEYHYRVNGVNAVGEGPLSNEVSALTALPAPTGLKVVNATADSAELAWTANHLNGETRVEVREDDDGAWTVDQTVAFDTESATVSGLLNGQLYGVRVVADTEDAEAIDQ